MLDDLDQYQPETIPIPNDEAGDQFAPAMVEKAPEPAKKKAPEPEKSPGPPKKTLGQMSDAEFEEYVKNWEAKKGLSAGKEDALDPK
jgi:hypothetical protein